MAAPKIGRTKHRDLALDAQAYIQSAAAILFKATQRITDLETAKLIAAALHDLQQSNQASEEIIGLIMRTADEPAKVGGRSYATQFAAMQHRIDEMEQRFIQRIAELEEQYQLRERS